MTHPCDIDPDDHGCYERTCPDCGDRVHVSEVHDCNGVSARVEWARYKRVKEWEAEND